MLTFTDKNMQQRLAQKYNLDASGLRFHSFPNLEDNVRNQVKKIKSTPFLPDEIPVYGFTYDVKTGKLKSLILSVVNRFEDCGKIIYHSFSKLASNAYLGSEFHE